MYCVLEFVCACVCSCAFPSIMLVPLENMMPFRGFETHVKLRETPAQAGKMLLVLEKEKRKNNNTVMLLEITLAHP